MSKTFNIKPSNCDFFVNEEQKTVACVCKHTSDLFIDFIADSTNIWYHDDKLYMPNMFVGVAKCSADDEWDPEIGKMIAFSRMKDKLNKSWFKRARYYVKQLDIQIDNTIELINQIGEKLTINQEKRNQRIANALGEVPKN